jgi:hypothetical protein
MFAINGAPLARRFRLGFLILFMAACTSDPVAALNTSESKLIADLNFDADLMKRIRASGLVFERLQMEDGNGDLVSHAGLVLVTPPGKAAAALTAVRATLENSAYGAWINDDGFGRSPDKIAIMKTHDQFVYLAVAHTDGINWDLDHAAVMTRYREWAVLYGLELKGAGLDWLSARISKPPKDWAAFAREVYKFCPDIVDQGAETVEALTTEMRARNELYLWWD